MAISAAAIRALRERIIAQADAQGADGWMSFPVPTTVRPDGVLRVPRGAFERWAVWRSGGGHLTVPWTPVSPHGVKQGADDPNHTDWMLGAGLDPQAMRDGGGNPHWRALSKAAYAAREAVEQRLLGFTCSVLMPGRTVVGRVHAPASSRPNKAGALDLPAHDEDGQPPVLVVPHASAEWLTHALAALDAGGAVIVENGGEMAHLITVARGMNKGPIVRMAGARKLYPADTLVCVSPGDGTIALQEDARLVAQFIQEGLRAQAMAQDLESPEPAPKTTAPVPSDDGPRHAPANGFVVAEWRSGDPRHPAERMRCEIIQAKVEGPHHNVHCVAFTDRAVSATLDHRSPFNGPHVTEVPCEDRVVLRMIVSRRDRKDRRVFYTNAHRWQGRDEIRKACWEALYQVDPEARFRLERWAEQRQAEEAAKVAELAALDDEALIAKAKELGDEEHGLIEGYESNFYDAADMRHFRHEYEQAFRRIDWLFLDRGMAVHCDDFRPMLQEPVPNAYFPDRFPQDRSEAVTSDAAPVAPRR